MFLFVLFAVISVKLNMLILILVEVFYIHKLGNYSAMTTAELCIILPRGTLHCSDVAIFIPQEIWISVNAL